MKAIAFFCIIVTLTKCDTIPQINMTQFYKVLGCIAEEKQNVMVYDCSKIYPDKDKCYYKGQPFNGDDYIPSHGCRIGCYCAVSGSSAIFMCAQIHCPLYFDRDKRKQCILLRDNMNDCCPSKRVCGKDEKAKLAKCVVNGETYYEGQSFKPSAHLSCFCSKKWNGVVDDQSCRPIQCEFEIHYQDYLRNMCAPVFSENSLCPNYFICPDSSTRVIKGENLTGVKTKCVIGNTTLSIGDKVYTKENCIKCSCQNPPYVSCLKKDSYC